MTTTTQPTAEQLEVTQADWDAAERFRGGAVKTTWYDSTIEMLANDFARHRQATEARCAEMLENKAQAMLNIDPDGAQEVAEALIMAARTIRSQSNDPTNP